MVLKSSAYRPTLSAFEPLLVTSIIVGAVVLRFYKLGEWSLKVDEVTTIQRAMRVPETALNGQSNSVLLEYVVLSTLGIREWTARLVPALLGILTLVLVYIPVRMLFGLRVALLSILLLALSPWHLDWSQNARFYTALFLFYTMGLFAFYDGIERDRPLSLVGALILFGLAVQERMLGLFFIPVTVSYLLLLALLPWSKPPGLRWRNLALFFGPGLIAGLYLYITPYLLNPEEWTAFFGYANTNPAWILAGIIYYIGLPAIIMAMGAALYFLRQTDRAVLFLLASATVPIAALLLLSTFNFTANRYAFITLMSWLILAALGVEAIRRLLPPKRQDPRLRSRRPGCIDPCGCDRPVLLVPA